MLHSLRFRLFIAFTIVIMVAVGAVYFFVSRMTGGEINRYGERSEQMRFSRVGYELARYYNEHGSWEGVQPLITQWGNLYGQRIILTDTSGVVIADSRGELLGKQYQPVMGMPGMMGMPGRPLMTPRGGNSAGTVHQP